MTLLSTLARTLQPLALHRLQRFGSFWKFFKQKKTCSPALKTNSSPQSRHFSVLSMNSTAHPAHWPAAYQAGFVQFRPFTFISPNEQHHGLNSAIQLAGERIGRKARHTEYDGN